jgi:Ulp1 family protease
VLPHHKAEHRVRYVMGRKNKRKLQLDKVRRTKANVHEEEKTEEGRTEEGKIEKEKDVIILSNPSKEASAIEWLQNSKFFVPPYLDRQTSSMFTKCSSMQASLYDFFVGFNPSIVLYEHKIRRIFLRHSDILTIHGKSWMNDLVIDLYLFKIVQNLNDCVLKNSFFLQSLNPSNPIPHAIPDDVLPHKLLRIVKKSNVILSKQYVFFPINIQNVHWIICIAEINSKKIILYDSLGELFSAKHRKIMEILNAFFVQLFPNSHWEFIYHYEPKQEDKTSCGVFICAFMESYVTSGFKIVRHAFNQSNVPFLRLRIAHALLQN